MIITINNVFVRDSIKVNLKVNLLKIYKNHEKIIILYVNFYVYSFLWKREVKNSDKVNPNKTYQESSDPCDDMLSYNRGINTGRANKNYYGDCDYFWKLDNDGNMSKSCYCKGYDSIKKEF